MLSAYLSTFKRKFYAIVEECDANPKTTDFQACSPRKRLQVEALTSMNEGITPITLAACAAGSEEEEISPPENAKEEQTVEELEAEVKELEDKIVRDIKVAERIASKLKKVKEEDLECMVCRDTVQNPQLLPCGHSACYGCLRNWWTRPLSGYDGAEMIDTEAEDDTGEEAIVGDEPNPEAEEATPESCPRRRHTFRSAVNRDKACPCCQKVVKCRPVPDPQLCDIVETLNKDLAPLPSHIQARREARLTRRSDLWHGIFHPENQQGRPTLILAAVVEPLPALPPPHPDPILNDIAQAQYRRAVEEAVARQETARWDRAQAQRAAVMDRPIRQQGFAPANPPPVVPQEAVGRDVPDVVQLRQDPVPGLPVVDILPPPNEDPAPI